MKKILAVLVLTITLFTGSQFVSPAYAASCGFGDIGCWFTSKLSDIVAGTIVNTEGTLTKQIGGTNATLGDSGNTAPPKTMAEATERYGALGFLGMGMQQMYQNPPITTQEYFASIKPLTPVFAASSTPNGATTLGGPIGSFWEASRNLAYLLYAVILVVIGFMILFRSKIDPRTTVTVTAAIPNIIISLILITFSLALAAFMIDIGRVLEDLVKALINGGVTPDKLVQPEWQVGLTTTDIWGRFISISGNNSFVNLGGGTLGGLVGALITFILFLFAFIVGIMLFFTLLFRFINLLVKPIFAPLVFLFGAIPGKSSITVNWFKGYMVDVLTFPIVLIILNLASAVKQAGQPAGAGGDPFGFLAPGANLNGLIAIGILLIATKVPSFLEAAFDVKPDSHVARGGADAGKMLTNVPVIGSLFKGFS